MGPFWPLGSPHSVAAAAEQREANEVQRSVSQQQAPNTAHMLHLSPLVSLRPS